MRAADGHATRIVAAARLLIARQCLIAPPPIASNSPFFFNFVVEVTEQYYTFDDVQAFTAMITCARMRCGVRCASCIMHGAPGPAPLTRRRPAPMRRYITYFISVMPLVLHVPKVIRFLRGHCCCCCKKEAPRPSSLAEAKGATAD